MHEQSEPAQSHESLPMMSPQAPAEMQKQLKPPQVQRAGAHGAPPHGGSPALQCSEQLHIEPPQVHAEVPLQAKSEVQEHCTPVQVHVHAIPPHEAFELEQ
jgi:hypothetical protein